jgi:hypothetical protein
LAIVPQIARIDAEVDDWQKEAQIDGRWERSDRNLGKLGKISKIIAKGRHPRPSLAEAAQ